MNTEMENGIQMTLEQWMPELFQKPTVGVSAHLARISVLPEKEQALTETDHPSLEKYLESSGKRGNKIDLNGLSMKTLRECFRQIGGGDFLSILMEMDELGYDTEWQIFNSKNWGVPQNRERVYTVGHFRAKGRRQIFPIGTADGKDSIQVRQIGQIEANRDNPQRYRVYSGGGVSPTLTCMGGGGLEPHIPVTVSRSGIGGGYRSESHPNGTGLQGDRQSGNDGSNNSGRGRRWQK